MIFFTGLRLECLGEETHVNRSLLDLLVSWMLSANRCVQMPRLPLSITLERGTAPRAQYCAVRNITGATWIHDVPQRGLNVGGRKELEPVPAFVDNFVVDLFADRVAIVITEFTIGRKAHRVVIGTSRTHPLAIDSATDLHKRFDDFIVF